MSNNYEKHIREYDSKIKTLKDFVEAVRVRPGMYIGPVGTQGHLNMIREIFQNACDELVRGMLGKISPCTYIYIRFCEKTKVTTVEDNGRGIPFSSLKRIFTKQHTSANYEKQEWDFSSGHNGVGAKITNALSDWFEITSYVLGEARYIKFIDGRNENEPITIENPKNKQGTIVSFKPSEQCLEKIETTVNDVYGLVKMILPLLPINAVVKFEGVYSDGKVLQETLVNEKGINYIIESMLPQPLVKPICMSKETGLITADISFSFSIDNFDGKNVYSYANLCSTIIESTHTQAFIKSVSDYFRKYMNNIFLTGKKKITIQNIDVETSLNGVVAIKHLNPKYDAQIKNKISNEDIKPFLDSLIKESLDEWCKKNSNDLQKICNHIKSIAEIRIKADKDKTKLSNNYKATVFGLPDKYYKPSGKQNLELLVFEGDSALQSARNARCSKRQGLFCVTGKIPSAFNVKKSEFFSNQNIAGLYSILGASNNGKIDMDKFIWDKIIIAVDADIDGRHIRATLLKNLLVYTPELIKAGKVYSLLPPLYSIKKSNGKYIYLNNKYDYTVYVQKEFCKDNNVCDEYNRPITNNAISKILLDNYDYTYLLERIANKYAIDFDLLETIVLGIMNNFTTLEKDIREKFRFIDSIYKEKNNIIIKGLINRKYQTVIVNNILIQDCNVLIDLQKNNTNKFYYMNGIKTSIYGLMKRFESYSPKSLQYYKGLGEMNSEQLEESCIHPDYNRTLIQYTTESVLEELERIKYLESNKGEFLMNTKVTRLDLL